MEKYVLKRSKPRRNGRGEVIRITDAAYEVLSGLSAESGKSISFIASDMICFLSDRTVIEDEDES